ncbi:NAD(P)H dehydrogenase [Streptacidiphilus sp. PB12-B1b]|uniref:FMN-dependent NADH-azoreductase n=1 Tax=Streptacidiphilus sp. PB12-B1b TaxID=2705012 RepID=UPI0015F82042|nr:NAD(P)H-dependent oxidoreductase [Streptacidiphilus sp. PB12-B1b]QMU75819.1 NAD(P)H dehydrogenase [Streptacidiphilus sp. PB12-B1b]
MTADRPALLHLDASPSRSADSVSRQLTALFADAWRERHGSSGYRYRDVAADPVPLTGGAYATLGRRVERHGAVPLDTVAELVADADEEREWALTLPLISELLAADTVLIGTPMYNLSVPAAMKAWIDRVTFPGAYTDPATGEHLLARTRVVVVTARGGSYGPGTPREGMDFQLPYLRCYFRGLGVAESRLYLVNADLTRAADIPALAGFQGLAAASLAAATAEVTALAAGGVRAG